MPVLPDFNPELASTGVSGQALLSGEEQGQSMMQRAQAMEIARQRQDDLHNELIAKLPAIQAESEQQVVGAHAAVANAANIAKLHAKANAESVGYNQEFQDAMQLAGWNERADALAALQPKIAYMSLFPEYKGFVDTVNNQRVQAHQSALADVNLEIQQQKADELLAGRLGAAEIAAGARRDVATTAAAAKTASADRYTASRERIAQIQSDTKLTAQERAGQIAALKSTQQMRNLLDAADEAENQATEASSNGDEAMAATHRQAAAFYRAQAQKGATYSGEPAPVANPTSRPFQSRPAAAQPPASSAPPEPPVAAAPGAPVIFQPEAAAPVAPAAPAAAAPAAPAAAAPASPAPKPEVAPTKFKASDIQSKNGVRYITIGSRPYPLYRDKNGNLAYNLGGHFVEIQTE